MKNTSNTSNTFKIAPFSNLPQKDIQANKEKHIAFHQKLLERIKKKMEKIKNNP